METKEKEKVRQAVRESYGNIAKSHEHGFRHRGSTILLRNVLKAQLHRQMTRSPVAAVRKSVTNNSMH